ncbi:MAG: agmatinase [Candidatus Lokiarchaeota archaeon]|nr:agmatinase [Candidatus Lokiarchaeota archaeon]
MTFFDFGETIDNNTEFVFFGIPWDYLSSLIVADSARAPQKIREISENLGLTTEMGVEIPKLKVVDIGNISIEPVNIEKNIIEIVNFMKSIFNQKKEVVPIMVGGDHFCTYPVVKAIGDSFDRKSEFGILIFDAHLDLYENYDKGKYSHATVSHRIFDLDYISKNNLLIVGTRDIDVPELDFAKSEQITYLNAYVLHDIGIDAFVDKIINFFKKSNMKNIYISIDIDVLDPSVAPGTGYAIPGGFTYREIWKIFREITKNVNIIGFDIVEVSPSLDLPNNITLKLAAKIIIELVSFILTSK